MIYMDKQILSMKDIKKLYGISRMTLINWEKKGLIKPIRTPGGQRRYIKRDIDELLQLRKHENVVSNMNDITENVDV